MYRLETNPESDRLGKDAPWVNSEGGAPARWVAQPVVGQPFMFLTPNGPITTSTIQRVRSVKESGEGVIEFITLNSTYRFTVERSVEIPGPEPTIAPIVN